MEEEVSIQEMLSGSELDKAIAILTSQSKDHALIANYVKEYKDLDRKIRETQVGNVQLDKFIGEGESRRQVKSIRSPVNYAKKIVTTACAFEVGEPVTLIPNEGNNAVFIQMEQLWQSNRIDDKLQTLKTTQKVETETAINFFIRDASTAKKATQPSKDAKKDIRSNIWTSKDGTMSPYFDANNDMKAFVWQFQTKNLEGKAINNTWVYDDLNCYKINDSGGTMALVSSDAHGFDRIPIVYCSQEFPEWYDVMQLIDRYEVALSKLGVSNDYSGHPILLTYGDLNILPEMNDDGKTVNFPIKFKEDDPKASYHGDAKFLTNDNAPEAVKLEMDTIRELIFSMTQTPDISFEKMKSIGAVSGVALRLMFLDPIIKAKMNEGQNRTIVQRIINILISGLTGVVDVKSKTQTTDLVIDVKFNSILPIDLEQNSTIASNGFTSQSMSTRTRVKFLGLVSDIDTEVAAIEKENPVKVTTPTPTV